MELLEIIESKKSQQTFAKDGVILIRPVKIDDADFYISVKIQHSMIYRYLVHTEKYSNDKILTDDLCQSESFFCIIEDVANHSPIGYIGIKDTRSDIWEVSIELDGDHTNKEYGLRSIRLFLNEMHRVCGKSEYKALVEADNIPSQKCLEKLSASISGLCNGPILTTNEEKEHFENRNLHFIDDNIRRLATRLNVEPRILLSHLLDYRLICPL